MAATYLLLRAGSAAARALPSAAQGSPAPPLLQTLVRWASHGAQKSLPPAVYYLRALSTASPQLLDLPPYPPRSTRQSVAPSSRDPRHQSFSSGAPIDPPRDTSAVFDPAMVKASSPFLPIDQRRWLSRRLICTSQAFGVSLNCCQRNLPPSSTSCNCIMASASSNAQPPDRNCQLRQRSACFQAALRRCTPRGIPVAPRRPGRPARGDGPCCGWEATTARRARLSEVPSPARVRLFSSLAPAGASRHVLRCCRGEADV